MTSITFFFYLIPILAIILLAVNFIFATHSPYQEKNSAFECGFHSFLGQNRMQFNISFYIFGLLFLLFDLEILLIYPYPLSAYFNSIYGLCVMLLFFIILTLGFAFELGKNALKIDSRQYDENYIVYKSSSIIESNILNIKQVSIYLFIFITYISIRYCVNIPTHFCMSPDEEPIDIEYCKDLIYSIQCEIQDHGLNRPNSQLTSDQLLAKREAQKAVKEVIGNLTELQANDTSKTNEVSSTINEAKRTADTISEENITKKNKLINEND